MFLILFPDQSHCWLIVVLNVEILCIAGARQIWWHMGHKLVPEPWCDLLIKSSIISFSKACIHWGFSNRTCSGWYEELKIQRVNITFCVFYIKDFFGKEWNLFQKCLEPKHNLLLYLVFAFCLRLHLHRLSWSSQSQAVSDLVFLFNFFSVFFLFFHFFFFLCMIYLCFFM